MKYTRYMNLTKMISIDDFLNKNRNFFRSVAVLSDDASFHFIVHGYVHIHNCNNWSTDNQRWISNPIPNVPVC